jgi:hypothetical protein
VLATNLQVLAEAMAGSETANDVQTETFAPVSELKPTDKKVTLEQVRAVLADKSHDGFTSEVRTLLEKHGAKKLSEIDPANYDALLADAEGLK